MPSWSAVDSIDELIEALELGLKSNESLVVKPPNDRGGRGIYIINQNLSGVNPQKERES